MLGIATAAVHLKAGDVIAYEFAESLVGTGFSPLHVALVLETSSTANMFDPFIINMDADGCIVTETWSEFARGANKDIIRMPLADDTLEARQHAVSFARRVQDRYISNPEIFPVYDKLWWNCETFVCACLTQGECAVSGQTLAGFALGARMLGDIARLIVKNK